MCADAGMSSSANMHFRTAGFQDLNQENGSRPWSFFLLCFCVQCRKPHAKLTGAERGGVYIATVALCISDASICRTNDEPLVVLRCI